MTSNNEKRIELLKQVFDYWRPTIEPYGDRETMFKVTFDQQKIQYLKIDRISKQLDSNGLLLYGIATNKNNHIYLDIVENEFN